MKVIIAVKYPGTTEIHVQRISYVCVLVFHLWLSIYRESSMSVSESTSVFVAEPTPLVLIYLLFRLPVVCHLAGCSLLIRLQYWKHVENTSWIPIVLKEKQLIICYGDENVFHILSMIKAYHIFSSFFTSEKVIQNEMEKNKSGIFQRLYTKLKQEARRLPRKITSVWIML